MEDVRASEILRKFLEFPKAGEAKQGKIEKDYSEKK